jgi:hypothetical protein
MSTNEKANTKYKSISSKEESPLEIKLVGDHEPNEKTEEAINEARDSSKLEDFSSMEELFKSLEK